MKPLVSGNKYYGKYVALSQFGSWKVISYGSSVRRVIERARKKGYQMPVVFFVPDPNIIYIY